MRRTISTSESRAVRNAMEAWDRSRIWQCQAITVVGGVFGVELDRAVDLLNKYTVDELLNEHGIEVYDDEPKQDDESPAVAIEPPTVMDRVELILICLSFAVAVVLGATGMWLIR
jgi:hypothetical protein